MDCSTPGSSVHGISQAEYWSRLPFPSPGDLPNPGIKSGFPALQVGSLPTELQGNSFLIGLVFFIDLCKREFYPETWDSLAGLLEILFLFMLSIAQLVKNPPTMQETPVRFLGQEDPLEKG